MILKDLFFAIGEVINSRAYVSLHFPYIDQSKRDHLQQMMQNYVLDFERVKQG